MFTDHELPKAERVGVRNEVIAYASGGAKQTMRELQHLGSGRPPSYRVTPITLAEECRASRAFSGNGDRFQKGHRVFAEMAECMLVSLKAGLATFHG